MKVLKNFNNISEELKQKISPLKGTQTFQMLTGQRMVEADTGKEEWVYGKHQIPTRDRIKDLDGRYVDIGVPVEFDNETARATRFFMPGIGEHQFTGRFSLIEGKLEDEEMWEYLSISNYNKSNPNRDTSKEAMFELLDFTEQSKKIRHKSNTLRDALILATEIDVPQAKDIAASLNWAEFTDHEVLLAKIEEFATENPDEFLRIYGDPNTKVKSDIKKALDRGILLYDSPSKRFLWAKGNVVIATLDKREGVSHLDAFAEYLMTSKNGVNVLQSVRKQIKNKLEPVEENG